MSYITTEFRGPEKLVPTSNRCITNTYNHQTEANANWILDNQQMEFDCTQNRNEHTDSPLNERSINNSKLDENDNGNRLYKRKKLIIKPYVNDKHNQNTYASVLKFPKMLFIPNENTTRYGKLWDNNKGRTPHSRVPWNTQEDRRLRELYVRLGPRWSKIAAQLGTARCGKQCEERYNYHLRPNITKDPLSKLEKMAISRLHQIYGPEWARIAKRLRGRTGLA
ncbi:8925_t:CDS:2, partial [Paraglomus occultum]